MSIQVSGAERVHCVVLDGEAAANQRALVNALRMGAGNHRLVVIGADDVIAATLGPMALSPADVECAPVGTEIPQGSNVICFKASTLS